MFVVPDTRHWKYCKYVNMKNKNHDSEKLNFIFYLERSLVYESHHIFSEQIRFEKNQKSKNNIK